MKQKQGYVVGFIESKNGVVFNRAVFAASKKKSLALEFLYNYAQRRVELGNTILEDYGDGVLFAPESDGYQIELEMYLCPILE